MYDVGFDHSAALCENHLHAIYAGANQVMVPAIELVQSPSRFWRALSDYRVSYTFAPNFFIAAAARALNDMADHEIDKIDLDLSELQVIMCGGEANRTATILAGEKILVRYGARKGCIKASYGLSEVRDVLSFGSRKCVLTFGDMLSALLQLRFTRIRSPERLPVCFRRKTPCRA